MIRVVQLVVPACLVVLSAARALGAEPQPPADASAPSTPVIRDQVARGDKARRAGRWREAAAAYADALAAAERDGAPVKQRAAIAGELGAAEVALGKYREGAEHLHLSMLHEDDLREEQRERLHLARKKAASELAILIVAVSPPGAQVTVDAGPFAQSRATSRRERATSHVLFLEPGQHTIEIALAGFSASTITLDLEKGTKSRVSQRLERQVVSIAAAPCAERAAAPAARPSTPCAPGRDWVGDLRTGAFITAGVGAAVGAGMLIAAVPVNDAIREHTETFGKRAGSSACRSPSPSVMAECEAQEARLTARAYLTGAGWVTLGVSGMLGAMAASSYFWGDAKRDAAPVRFTAISTGQYTGAAVLGAW